MRLQCERDLSMWLFVTGVAGESVCLAYLPPQCLCFALRLFWPALCCASVRFQSELLCDALAGYSWTFLLAVTKLVETKCSARCEDGIDRLGWCIKVRCVAQACLGCLAASCAVP